MKYPFSYDCAFVLNLMKKIWIMVKSFAVNYQIAMLKFCQYFAIVSLVIKGNI